MKILEKLLRGNENKINKNAYIWNSTAGLVNASEAVIVLMVATRITGIQSVGILTIGFALANLFMTVGKFGIRNFQISDIKKEYTFNTYFTSRIITVVIMILISLFFVFFKHISGEYTLEKAICIFLVCMLYVVEAYEDSFLGEYQLRKRLDIGAKVFSFRWALVITVLCLSLLLTRKVILSLIIAFMASCFFSFIFVITSNKIIGNLKIKLSNKGILKLLYTCTPLAVSGFCSFYIINAPKYAIDTYLNDTIQACYGFIAMPVFIIGLLNSFIYAPTIVSIAEEWNNGSYLNIKRRIARQFVIIIGITLFCIAGAYFLGIPVLSLLYKTDLIQYKTSLLILLAGSGFLAVSGYFGIILITMRKQRQMMYCYIIVAILAKLLSGIFVKNWYTLGAASINSILMMLLALSFFILLLMAQRKIIFK